MMNTGGMNDRTVQGPYSPGAISPLDPIERIVPGEVPEELYIDHIERYRFASKMASGKDVLDVACGCGYAAPVMCAAGAASYTGIDISEGAIELALKKYKTSGNVKFQVGDACILRGIPDRSIDLVVSFETIEHLSDTTTFLSNIARVLRPGGLLVISSPNRLLYSPGNKLSSKPDNPFHVREWTDREFIKLVGEFFRVTDVRGQHLDPLWKVCIRQGRRNYFVAAGMKFYSWAKRHKGKGHVGGVRTDKNFPGVQPIGRWQRAEYIVCLAEPR